MYRKAELRLKEWLRQPERRRKPIIFRGARQVGKSTLVRLFAAQAGLHLAEVNLEGYPDLNKVFATLNLQKILREIEAITAQSIQSGTLIFLDEIQASPAALSALRYFYEERPELPIIAAGSLLDFALDEAEYSVPVGRIEYCYLGPMDFEEFLHAKGKNHLLEALQKISFSHPVAEATHTALLDELKEFFFVGGMPEAVEAYVSGSTPQRVQEIHQSLLETFADDFNKYAKRSDIPLLHEVFRKIPAVIGKKVRYVELARDEKAREVKKVLQLLIQAKLITPVYAASAAGIPLNATRQSDTYKLLFLDVGLLNSRLGVSWSTLNRLPNDQLLTSGVQAEQWVGQGLLCQQFHTEPELHYWLREEKSHLAEIDYLIQKDSTLIPIEVKAGTPKRLKSIDQFLVSKKLSMALRFDASPASSGLCTHQVVTRDGVQKIKFQLLSLPLYAVGQVDRILEMMNT